MTLNRIFSVVYGPKGASTLEEKRYREEHPRPALIHPTTSFDTPRITLNYGNIEFGQTINNDEPKIT